MHSAVYQSDSVKAVDMVQILDRAEKSKRLSWNPSRNVLTIDSEAVFSNLTGMDWQKSLGSYRGH